jgi:hypothetical protein
MTTVQFKYYIEAGNSVVDFLKANGFPQAELIGSIAKIGFSNNDIDIYIPKSGTAEDRDKLVFLFLTEPHTKVDISDYGIMCFTETKFGDVDIFFSLDGFDY